MHALAPPPPNLPGEPSDEWRRTWFQNAHSDMRWAKEQGWKALQWIILLQAAATAAQSQLGNLDVRVFQGSVAGIGAVGVWYLIDLHLFGRSSRRTAEGLLIAVPGRDKYLPRRTKDRHHVGLLVVRIVITVASTVFALLVILQHHRAPTHG